MLAGAVYLSMRGKRVLMERFRYALALGLCAAIGVALWLARLA
jgi:hypothetical protein